jgi:hypothetical protein
MLRRPPRQGAHRPRYPPSPGRLGGRHQFGHRFHPEALDQRRRSPVQLRTDHWTPAEVVAQLEGSLRALQSDYVDLYQMHWPGWRHSRALPMPYHAANASHRTSKAMTGTPQGHRSARRTRRFQWALVVHQPDRGSRRVVHWRGNDGRKLEVDELSVGPITGSCDWRGRPLAVRRHGGRLPRSIRLSGNSR